MQTENLWQIKMVSKDNQTFSFCTIALTEEKAIENANQKITKNLWEQYDYKVTEIKYLGEKDG